MVAPEVRTTVTLDERVLRALKVKAARTGKGDSELIEEVLRHDLGLDVLDRLWAVNDMLALAEHSSAIPVSGDRHLLDLSERFPIRTTQELLQASSQAAEAERR